MLTRGYEIRVCRQLGVFKTLDEGALRITLPNSICQANQWCAMPGYSVVCRAEFSAKIPLGTQAFGLEFALTRNNLPF